MPNKTIARKNNLEISGKILGNKNFIKEYWKIITPAFLWAIIFSLGPIIMYVYIKTMLPVSISAVDAAGKIKDISFNNEIYLSFNYSSFVVFLIQNFIISLPIAAFPIIGQYLSRNNLIKLHQAFRSVLYISIIFALLLSLLEGFLANQLSTEFILSTNPGAASGALFLKVMAISNFFYIILWMMLSGYSANRMIWTQVVSAVIGFLVAVIVTPIFLIFAAHQADALINAGSSKTTTEMIYNLQYFIIVGLAIISIIWQIIPAILLFVLTFFKRLIVIKRVQIGNKKVLRIRSIVNPATNLMFFKTGWSFNWTITKKIFVMTWVIFIDQVLWSAAHFVLLVYSISFAKGVHAMEYQYKLVVSVATLIATYVVLIQNGFSIVSIYFISIPLGQLDYELTKKHTKWMLNWAAIIGFTICVGIMILSSFINPLLISGNANSHVQVKVNGVYTTEYTLGTITNIPTMTYAQIWQQATYTELIYAMIAMSSTIVSSGYFMLVSGGSKFIVFAGSFITIAFAIIVPLCSKYLTGIPDGLSILAYFFLAKMEDLVKLIFTLLLLFLGKNLNTVEKTKTNIDNHSTKNFYTKFEDKKISFANNKYNMVLNY